MHTCIHGLGCCLAMLTLGLGSTHASAAASEPEPTGVDLDARLQDLEERMEASEAKSAQPASIYDRIERTFNPKISAILQGRAAYYSGGDEDRAIPGFLPGDEVGRGPEGLSLGESELVFSANVDDKFYGFLDVSFDQSDIGIEEGYLSTLSAPLGFSLKAGRFFSAIGSHNERHSHTWDFVDSPLVYDVMLNGGLSDAGLQVGWIAPTDLYIELGGEVLRGDGFPAAGAAHAGFGMGTAFAKISGDVGDSHSWKVGLSYLRARSEGRDSDAGNGSRVSFDGSSELVIAEATWKWAPEGNFRARNLVFRAEYLHRHESGSLRSNGLRGRLRSDQDGFYAQGVYQFLPRWRIGFRYGQLFSENRVSGVPQNVLHRDFSSPRRMSAMVDFSNSEFSRLRLQYSLEAGGLGDDSLIYLQYIISIGSHGAHAF